MMVLDHPVAPTTILVVEDEMLLRMRAVDMVEDAGYISVEAVDAEAALAILESSLGIGLLFTDIQMPGKMDGLQLAHACMSVGRQSRSSWCPDNSGCPRAIFRPAAGFSESRSSQTK